MPFFAKFYNLNAEAFLHKSELVVFAKEHRFAVLKVDGVFSASFFVVNRVVSAVVEDYAVLENFANGCSLVCVSGFENVYCAGGVGGNGAGKEMSTCAKAKFCRTEWILNCAVRT